MNSLLGLISSFIVPVSSLLLFQAQETLGDKRCKKMVLIPENNGYYHSNHSILNLTDVTPDVCQITCYMNESCMSYNYCMRCATCEINDSDQYNHPDDFIRKAGSVYVGTENACSSKPCPSNIKCQPNFYTQSFSCLCPPGFSGFNCSDIDECKISPHTCSINHTCINTAGSYDCICKPGYQAHGILCSDIDECSTGADNCSADSSCLNTGGSFECRCMEDYKYFNNKCTKILGDYVITVHTGSKTAASTGAKVYIQFYGTHFNEQKASSKKRLNGNFEKSKIDTASINNELPNMESLSKINIGHDNTGLFPGWYLEKVIVDNKTRRMKYTFQCDCWVGYMGLPPTSKDIDPIKDSSGQPIVTRY